MVVAGILYFEVVDLTIPACRQCEIWDLYQIWLKYLAAAILDFQIMWICLFGCVDRVVFVFCTKLG